MSGETAMPRGSAKIPTDAKRIALVGFGRENEAAYRYFSQKNCEITIFDESKTPGLPIPEGARAYLGVDPLPLLKSRRYDLVLRTPPVPPARLSGLPVWSATREFFGNCPATIIGVTGTKGKGTVSSLIHSILTAAGRSSYLVGNIGKPALDILNHLGKDDLVVYELSSFQLWDLERSPRVAVVLMIEPDHLDVHPSFDDYFQAKANIVRWQRSGDTVVYNPRNQYSRQIAGLSAGLAVPFGQSPGAYAADGSFWINEQKICSLSHLKLPGQHNVFNACAAITATWQFARDPAAIRKGLASFKGLDHRLKLVAEVAGVSYYDDSIATTPGSAIAAIRAFDRPKILILGGSDKGADMGDLIKEIADNTSVKAVIAIGNLGGLITQKLHAAGYSRVNHLGAACTMDEIVAQAVALAQAGDIAILSPAAASFDMFKSYEDRGDQFKSALQRMAAGRSGQVV